MKRAALAFAFIVIAVFCLPPAANAAPASPPSVTNQGCGPRLAVTFTWTSSWEGQEWLDLSLANNGFAPASYVSVGPLATGTASFTWYGLAENRTHFVRVNTLSAAGWQASSTSSFVTGTCGATAAAQTGNVGQSCGGATLFGTFQWTPSQPAGSVQWLDLSTQNNGFAPGTFVSAGPLNGGASQFLWTGLLKEAIHYWRVNTWTGAAWVPSSTGSFAAGYCAPAAAPPPYIPPPVIPPVPNDYAEWVYVSASYDLDYEVLVARRNGELWLLEYGVGCLSLPFYEGRNVLVVSRSILFAGIGSHIVIPERDQECRIWDATQIR